MNKQIVYFTPWKPFENMLLKSEELYKKSEIFNIIEEGDTVAVKLHVGELGNPNYIRPFFVKQVVDLILEKGGNPFLTDTSTYYPLQRSNAVVHMQTAMANGFGFAPFIVADGLCSENGFPVKSPDKILPEVEIAGAIYQADAMIVISHLKGHLLSGFGGAIKNMGMGCVTKKSKLDQHRLVDLQIDTGLCEGCGTCVNVCWFKLPRIENDKAIIDSPKCMRCPICSSSCPQEAIKLVGKESISEGLAVATKAVLNTFQENKIGFITFATDIVRICDCAPMPGDSFQDNVGIFAGFSPLSIDAACLNSINTSYLEQIHKANCWIQANKLAQLGDPGSLTPQVL